MLAAVLIRMGIFADPYHPSERFYPYIIFTAGLVLSAIFNRSRIFFALLLLALTEGTLSWLLPRIASERVHHIVMDAVSVLLPVNLLALAFLRDRGIVSPVGRRRLLSVAAQAGAIALLCWPRLERVSGYLDRPFVNPRFTAWSHMSQVPLAAFMLAAVVLAIWVLWRYRAIENSLLWSVAAAFIALRLGEGHHLSAVFFSAAALAMIVAVIESSYSMAYLDELTQLPSRRSFNQAMLKLGDYYTIGMLDVDHFKRFNDTYGHDAGDQALRMVASKLAHLAGGGKAYRYGGEEFVILFPGKQADEAFTYLDRMRRLIEQSPFVVRGVDRRRANKRKSRGVKCETHVTVSIGIAARNGESLSPAEVLKFADQALYKAKARGRNCTVAARNAKPVQSVDLSARVLSVE